MPPTPPMGDWRPPETPEEQAAWDNYAAVCARIIWRKATNPLPEYKSGEGNRAPDDSPSRC